MLRTKGVEDEWIVDLSYQRKLFFHDTAPWIALKIGSREPLETELLILKKNVRELSESPDIIPFNRLKAINDGLRLAMDALKDWLIHQVRERDRELSSRL